MWKKALVAIATYRTPDRAHCELVPSNDRIATMTGALYRQRTVRLPRRD